MPEHMLHKYFPSQFIWEVFFHARISSQPLFHLKNPTMQDFYRSFNRDCELVSQLPIYFCIYIYPTVTFDSGIELYISYSLISVSNILSRCMARYPISMSGIGSFRLFSICRQILSADINGSGNFTDIYSFRFIFSFSP